MAVQTLNYVSRSVIYFYVLNSHLKDLPMMYSKLPVLQFTMDKNKIKLK